MKLKGKKPDRDLLEMAEWTSSDRILFDGCSVPIQKWTIPELKFRLSFQRGFFERTALVKQLISRGFTTEQVAEFEQECFAA
jgi:hypothetical protein